MPSELQPQSANGEDPSRKSPEKDEASNGDEEEKGEQEPEMAGSEPTETEATQGMSAAMLSKRQRKRDREKQRRSDLNHAFDCLMDLIFRIDPRRRDEAEAHRKGGGGAHNKGKNEDTALLSRLDIINEAVDTMGRVHRENEERKGVILHLSRGLLASQNNGPPVVDPVSLSHLSAVRELERQDLQRQIELDALLAVRRVGLPPPPLRSDTARALQAEAALTDLASQRTLAARQLALQGERSPIDSLGRRSEGLMVDAAIQRARLNQLIQEDREYQAASMGIGADAGLGRLVGRGLNEAAPPPRSHGGYPDEPGPYSPPSKRMRDSY